MLKSLIASLVALGGVVVAMPSANSAPTSPIQSAPSSTTSHVERVDWAGGRYHCHGPRRNGNCHGGARRSYQSNRYNSYNRGYYDRPGITLRFGTGNRYRDNRRWR